MSGILAKGALSLGCTIAVANAAHAADTFSIGFIDPLSGPGATVGAVGLKTWQFLAKTQNAKGGIDGKQVDIVPFDNKLSPSETTIQAGKAIDNNIRLLVRSNGGAAGVALNEYLNKFNARNPSKETMYFDYSGTDPAATRDKCSYWQIRWAADVNMKALALAAFIKDQPDVKKVFLIVQDYSTGQGVRSAVIEDLKKLRPDIEIVGDEIHPLMKVADFAPYIAKIKASGADSVITGDWGQDLALLLKAAGEAGLKSKWFTFFAQGAGSPTAVRQAGLPPHSVYEVYEGDANVENPQYRDMEKAFRDAVGQGQTIMYPGAFNAMTVLADTSKELGTTDPVKVIASMEGRRFTTIYGDDAWIRKEDHQVFQPLYIASFGPLGPKDAFDEEGTGWGWHNVGKISAEATVLAPECKMNRPK